MNFQGSAFGIILPPPLDPKWISGLELEKQPTLIVLDNDYFYAVDLNIKEDTVGEGQENDKGNCVQPLIPISIGIGGYMPRYISRCMNDG